MPMRHITIIEDETDISTLLAHCLTCEGFQVTTAADGRVGLDIVRSHHPDLVILDLLLPDLHGREVLATLKASEATRAIPVVILSADGDVANRVALLEAGVDDYIVKPCSIREVIARSRAVLRRTAEIAGAKEGRA